MRDLLPDHELTGKRVDIDFRNQKEWGQPYEAYFTTVGQNLLVRAVHQDCHGGISVTADGHLPFSIKRVCKVYD